MEAGIAGGQVAGVHLVGAVLIADLTGFGRLTEAEGDEAAAEVAIRFAALVREALAPGERLVKTLGDGVLVVSPDVGTARATAARIRHRVAADGSLPPVHAGVRAGTVVWRDGDVFGAAVNDAARLAEAAGPWEIAEAAPPGFPSRPLVLDLSE
ncbi:MAG TPA: hypothetical protein VFH50_08605 [Acidimicrobiales bacterium]|nr:hypothetical protein [Acidimicrobiales bacterium]